MKVVKQISSLEKVRFNSSMGYNEINRKTLLRGERFSYQIAAKCDMYHSESQKMSGKIEVESPLSPYIKIFYVDNAVMDCPITNVDAAFETDYITTEPGLMPDILVPIEEKDKWWIIGTNASCIWVEVNVPKDIEPGLYDIIIKLRKNDGGSVNLVDSYGFIKKMTVEIIEEKMMPQKLIYTRWFYADCISDYHNVEVYSESHWKLIEKYIQAAADGGVNMILVPVHTPPLDTAVGHTRPCVQLVDIKKDGENYTFGFEKFHRFIEICKRCGIEYYEIAHMFSQWGAKFAPNVMVEENDKKSYLFGWHTESDSELYTGFLKQYIAAIHKALICEGIDNNTYFHISDEPSLDNIETYKKASEMIRPLIGESKTFDALSPYEFYEKGLVECPVTCIEHINDFLGKNVENQWVYYCCGPQSVYSNSFIAMPSSRVRILGFLLYKYDIKGFLHWGLNYYNTSVSLFKIDPYVTTSASGNYPSGDPFILYPSKDGAYNSIRGKVTYEAISDMRLCQTLEKYIGRDAVVELIDYYSGGNLTFDSYPVGNEYIENMSDRMKKMIKEGKNDIR